MNLACDLALRGRGAAAPNPCVGAVLVRDGVVVAKGWHKAFGGPHAERECLADAYVRGESAAGCDMYVTLEPCNHHGKTPPCTDALIEAGVRRVFVGCADPNPDVAGGGMARLKEAGIEVVRGVQTQRCRDLIADFLIFKRTDRPFVILKMASTLDGRIAARFGRPEKVSGPESRADVQRYRSWVGAVMVGGKTLLSDNPSLDCRMEGLPENFQQPYALVVTSRLPRVSADFQLIYQRGQCTAFLTTERMAESRYADDLRELGVRVWGAPCTPYDVGGGLDLEVGLAKVRHELGVHHVMCEGGGRLATSLLEQGLVDEFVLYQAPRVLGDDTGKELFVGRDVKSMDQTLDFRYVSVERLGDDLKLVLRPREYVG